MCLRLQSCLKLTKKIKGFECSKQHCDEMLVIRQNASRKPRFLAFSAYSKNFLSVE